MEISMIDEIRNSSSKEWERREIASLALAALLSNPVHSQKWTFTFWQRIRRFFGFKYGVNSSVGNGIPSLAVKMADELIAELNKTPE